MTPPGEVRIATPAWVGDVVEWGRAYTTDEERMALAIRLAHENVTRGTGGPFGAAVFRGDTGRLVSVGVNDVVGGNNAILHAEVVAIALAGCAVGSYTLSGPDLPPHELVTSCEPCAMCLGAIFWSGVRRVTIGASRDDAIAIGFDEGPVFAESYRYMESRGITFVRGILRDRASDVLRRYVAGGGRIYNA